MSTGPPENSTHILNRHDETWSDMCVEEPSHLSILQPQFHPWKSKIRKDSTYPLPFQWKSVEHLRNWSPLYPFFASFETDPSPFEDFREWLLVVPTFDPNLPLFFSSTAARNHWNHVDKESLTLTLFLPQNIPTLGFCTPSSCSWV